MKILNFFLLPWIIHKFSQRPVLAGFQSIWFSTISYWVIRVTRTIYIFHSFTFFDRSSISDLSYLYRSDARQTTHTNVFMPGTRQSCKWKTDCFKRCIYSSIIHRLIFQKFFRLEIILHCSCNWWIHFCFLNFSILERISD